MNCANLRVLLIFIILDIIYSCNSDNNYKAPVFKEMGIITGDILIKDVLCTDIWTINVFDSLLILNCHNTLDNKIFYFYNKNTGKLIKTFGEKGKSPGQLPNYFDISFDKKNKKIYIIGSGWNISYNIDSILNSSKYICDEMLKGEGLGNSLFIGYFKDSLLYSICDFRLQRYHRIGIFKSNGDIVSRYSFLPAVSRIDKDDSVYRMLFYSYKTLGALKPDASKLVLVTTCGLHMEIFNVLDNEIKLDKFHRYIKPKYLKINPVKNKGVIEGISSLYSTNKYIYALWSKNPQKEIPKQLAIFDWKGDAVRRYNFDLKIRRFTVENDDSKVYAVVKDKEGRLNIVRYKIN